MKEHIIIETSLARLNKAQQLAHLQRLAQIALAAYNLSKATISPLRSGNNAVFKVETQLRRGKAAIYVLRVHRPGYRKIEETRSELRFLRGLRQEVGLSVPEPIPTANGDLLTFAGTESDNEPRHCSLLSWLEGQKRWPGEGLGLRGLYRLGETLGHIHRYAQHFIPSHGFQLPRWDADGLFTEASPYRPGPLKEFFSPADRGLFDVIEQRARAVFVRLGQGPEQFGIIHADFILGNCQFHGTQTQVLDFDDCGWGYFIYDLCPLLGNLKDYPSYRALRVAFLAGYRNIRPLPKEFEIYIDLFIAARHATSCLWAAGCQRNRGLGPAASEHIAYRIGEIRTYLASEGK